MRVSRIFRLIVRVFLYVFTISLTIVSLLGGLSAIIIITNPDNIGIPDGPIEFYYDPAVPAANNITIPFNFTNDGYFSLTNLYIRVRLNMTYDHVNLTGPGVNTTTTRTIFDGEQSFTPIAAKAFTRDNLVGESGDFNVPDEADIDFTAPISFWVDLFLSASYSLDLLSFRIVILNLSISAI